MKSKIILFLTPWVIASSLFSQNIKWVSSEEGHCWQVQEIKVLKKMVFNTDSIIQVYPSVKYQKIKGFGGAYSELGGLALTTMPENKRMEVMNALFNENEGCGFTLCRIPIGASDFALGPYSLDDSINDYLLEHFSIERDKNYLLPYIKLSQRVNPSLEFWASPWSPPAWMKKNGYYGCKGSNSPDWGDLNGKCCDELVKLAYIREDSLVLNALARYFIRFLEEYKTEGVDVQAVHFQNEPLACAVYPSCLWKPPVIKTFLRDYMIPVFKEKSPDTEIWIGTLNTKDSTYIDSVIDDPYLRENIAGFGFQWEGKFNISYLKKHYPEIRAMQTESECGNGLNSWASVEHIFSLMKHYFDNGAESYIYWNMILDELGFSTWAWRQNSLVSINKYTRDFVLNPEYYLMKHFAAFVKPGWHKVETLHDDDCIAFANDQGQVVLNIMNKRNLPREISVNVGNAMFQATLKANSLNSFVLE